MLPPSSEDCDSCSPAGLARRSPPPVALLISTLPFALSFLFVATLVFQRLFPLLSTSSTSTTNPNKPPTFPRPRLANLSQIKSVAALTFSTTLALAAVLAELILCEISDTINPAARGVALQLTIVLLLALLVVAIPTLEIASLVSAAGWHYTGPQAGKLRLAWVLHIVAFGAWLGAFWFSGRLILGEGKGEGWINGAVEHVGVIGISLMALLSGFASVSAPWQSFGARQRPVSETGLARKKAGLESTNEMLGAKRSRLRALEQKLAKAPKESMLQKAMGTFRGNADAQEKKGLEMEIWGLENMAVTLGSQHALLQGRWQQQQLGKTRRGQVVRFASRAFSVYCLYRVVAAAVTFCRRRWSSSGRNVGSDPVNSFLALIVKTYDSQLDREAWTRQISFLLSGVMLCASISSVMQTFHFFSRYTPGLLKAAQANLALLVAQICATYVISVALLLRGIMPGEVVSDRLRSLGGNDMQWVDRWFEEWFLGGVVVTMVGIWASKKIVGSDDWDDDDDVELGKLH